MQDILTFTILGAASGAVLALLGLGVNIVYRASRVMNFSQPAIGLAAAYTYIEFLRILPTGLALVGAILVGLTLGAVVELLVMRPLQHSSTLTKAIATIGVLLVLQSVINLRYGYTPVIVPSWLPVESVTVFGVALGLDRYLTLLIVVLVMVGLQQFYKRTSIGLASTALAANPRALAALGTHSPSRVSLVNWMLSGGVAALAGLLLSPVTSLTPTLALSLVVPVLSVALVGRLESFVLTFIGGVGIGVAQSLIGWKLDEIPGVQDAVPFLVVALLLTLRGATMPARGEQADRLPAITPGRIPWVPSLIVGVLTAVLILTLPEHWVSAITVTLATATVLLSLVIVTGYAGQLNLASFALAGVAVLVSAVLISAWEWPFLAAALMGVVMTIPVGIIVGLPAVRSRGTALAVITLGLAVAFQSMVLDNSAITNGIAGFTVGSPTILGVDFSAIFHPRRYALLVLVVFTALGFMILKLRRSGPGRRMAAVRGNEAATASIGVSVARTKLYAFVASAMVAGVGGVLIAYMNETITLSNPGGRFGPASSINAIAQSTIGGNGWVGGAVAGAMVEQGSVMNLLMRFLTEGAWLSLIGGLLMLVTVITAPAGIAAINARALRGVFDRLPGAQQRAEREQGRSRAMLDRPLERRRVEPATLSAESLSVSFTGTQVLYEISFELRPGMVLGVIGPNGAGKTTLLEALTGYNQPQEGRVVLDGADISSLSSAERARRGVVRSFQSLELFEDLTVLENLLVASEPPKLGRTLLAGVTPDRDRLSETAIAGVEAFGLAGRLNALPSDLSYGERRLLAIARALAARPRVLLLDEPAAGLGATERAELRTIIRLIADEWGIAVFLIEHDVDLVMETSDKVLALDFGRVIATGRPEEVRTNAEVIAAYLGSDDPIEAGDGVSTSLVKAIRKGSR